MTTPNFTLSGQAYYIPSQQTIMGYIYLLGLLAAGALLLVALWVLMFLVTEVIQAIAEIAHLISTANPIVVSALIVLIAVWLLSKWKR